jgi:hypothetical protein
MPKKSSTTSQRARKAARNGAKYTIAFRHYSGSGKSAPPRADSLIIASGNLFPKMPDMSALLPKAPDMSALLPKMPDMSALLPKMPDMSGLLPKWA